MSANKHSLLRYKVLDQCFRNPGKRYFIEDLIAACNRILIERNGDFGGISKRQIYEDIRFMESIEGWEIKLSRLKEKKRVYYRYVNKEYSISNMPLNEIEINQLQSAIEILSQFRGMPQFDLLQMLLPKLRNGEQDYDSKVIVEFDNNQYLRGIEYFASIYNAIHYEKVLRIMYRPFDEKVATEIMFHPYLLKQYNNRWFVFGFNAENQKFDWNLALDRIESIMESTSIYRQNLSINWREYFEDIIGVTKPSDGKIEKIRLRFFGRSGKYMMSKPIHGSQKAQWLDDQTLEITLELITNYELERFILSYCDTVLIMEPPALVQKIRYRIEEAKKVMTATE